MDDYIPSEDTRYVIRMFKYVYQINEEIAIQNDFFRVIVAPFASLNPSE